MRLTEDVDGGLTDEMRGVAAAHIGEFAHQAGDLDDAEKWLDLSISIAQNASAEAEERDVIHIQEAQRRLLRSKSGRRQAASKRLLRGSSTLSGLEVLNTVQGKRLVPELRNRSAWLSYRSGN